MLGFKRFLKETAEAEQEALHLKHLTHVNMHPIDDGEEGYHRAVNLLNDTHEQLKNGHNDTKITTKYDGSPSIVFGKHPVSGKFFVASKSAFNKNPKINYTPSDVDTHHGHIPELASKLKHALKHLKKVTPKEGVYQGDYMHDDKDITDNGKSVSFKPNTITYTAHGDDAKKVRNSKIGVVVHTKYHGPTLETMRAHPDPDLHNFAKHKDVHVIDPEIDFSKIKHSPESEKEYNEHMNNAHKEYKNADFETFSAVTPHKEHLNTYLNDTVRTGEVPSVKGYKNHLSKKLGKEVDKVKTDAAKARKTEVLNAHLAHVDQHEKHFKTAFNIHSHLQKAKNVLVNSLSSSPKFEVHIGDTPTKDEGFVASNPKHGMTKLVNQEEFSRANLLKTRNK